MPALLEKEEETEEKLSLSDKVTAATGLGGTGAIADGLVGLALGVLIALLFLEFVKSKKN